MIDITTAISSLVPTPAYYWVGDNYKDIEWQDDRPQPTEAEIAAEMQRLQAEYDSQEYARLRKTEYDKLNQFEMQFDDQLNGTNTWVDAINDIKARFPK